MPSDKQLVGIDHKQENAILQVLPSGPICTINKSGWKNIKLEYHELPGYEVAEHSSKQNVLVALHKPSRQVRRRLGDEFADESGRPGDIVFCPTGVPHSISWEQEAHFSLVFLEPKYFKNVAHEIIDPDDVELLPRFAQSDPIIYEIVQALRIQSQLHQEVSQFYLDSVALFLASHLLENHCTINHKIKEKSYVLSDGDLEQVLDYIEANLGKKLGLGELAGLLNMSHYHFSRLFKETTGETPYGYVISRRVKKAKSLLARTDLGIREIAQITGFQSHSHFCVTFRRQMMMSPDQYRKM